MIKNEFCNENYKVIASGGSITILDNDEKVINKITKLSRVYEVRFRPYSNEIVAKPIVGPLLVYDLDKIELIKKINVDSSNAQDYDIEYSSDGLKLYNIECCDNDLVTQIVVYNAGDYSVDAVLFQANDNFNPRYLEVNDAGTIYVIGVNENKSYIAILSENSLSECYEIDIDVVDELRFSDVRDEQFLEKCHRRVKAYGVSCNPLLVEKDERGLILARGGCENSNYIVRCTGYELYIYNSNCRLEHIFSDYVYVYQAVFYGTTNILVVKALDSTVLVYDLDRMKLVEIMKEKNRICAERYIVYSEVDNCLYSESISKVGSKIDKIFITDSHIEREPFFHNSSVRIYNVEASRKGGILAVGEIDVQPGGWFVAWISSSGHMVCKSISTEEFSALSTELYFKNRNYSSLCGWSEEDGDIARDNVLEMAWKNA